LDVRLKIIARCHPERSRGIATGHIFGCPSTLLGVTGGVFRQEAGPESKIMPTGIALMMGAAEPT